MTELKLEQIVGLEDVKESIINDLLLRVNKDQPQKMILLEGPSGTCKTTLAEAIVKHFQEKYPGRFIYIEMKTEDVTRHVATTSQQIKLFFNGIRTNGKPTIVLIDEADELLSTRKDVGDIKMERTTNIMRQLNDEIPNLYIIATTNRPKLIDRAVLELVWKFEIL
jgi:SpoVK/Ycf46/Vps4 family AAA+-type ATPase